ncbi:hypothetical protein F5Y15DRAFT_252585 [Xylariaceae sp. FL0016]|nr:hypothetical protein F5Y15DRAFT_252585 [Xylariaceae sp. FL0016]
MPVSCSAKAELTTPYAIYLLCIVTYCVYLPAPRQTSHSQTCAVCFRHGSDMLLIMRISCIRGYVGHHHSGHRGSTGQADRRSRSRGNGVLGSHERITERGLPCRRLAGAPANPILCSSDVDKSWYLARHTELSKSCQPSSSAASLVPTRKQCDWLIGTKPWAKTMVRCCCLVSLSAPDRHRHLASNPHPIRISRRRMIRQDHGTVPTIWNTSGSFCLFC